MSEDFERAKVHIDRGETDQAIQALGNHLNLDFNDADALFMLGACFISRGFHGIAAALTYQALKIKPKFPDALINLGGCFKRENRHEQAEGIWRAGLDIQDIPLERAKLYNNLGTLFVNEGRPDKAIAYFDEGVRLAPEMPDLQFNRALAYLEQGQWRRGWKGYERGWESGDRRSRHYKKLPLWDGSPDQRVIVWGEQGVGDEILFASCLPDLIRISTKVIFDCHHRLEKLFERSFPEVEIHGTRKQLNNLDWVEACEADAHVCISSLPSHFRNEDKDFPGKPFLKADALAIPGKTLHLYESDGTPITTPGKPRVGLSWTGGTKKTRRDLRSIPLADLVPVLKAVDADFYSLQYTPNAAREACELEETTGIRVKHFPGWVEHKDYDRTASFVASMDLVITVGTAVHHLSNALGVPTWTLCPAKPSWRYTEKARLWYAETSRQFRQKDGEDWTPVINEVATALKERFA